MNKKFMDTILYRFQYVIFVAVVLIFFIEAPGIPAYIVGGAVFLYILFFEICMLVRSKDKRRMAKSIVAMLNPTTTKRLEKFPLPVIVSDKDGKILWYSDRFMEQVGGEKSIKLKIMDEINPEILKKQQVNIIYNNRSFSVFSDFHASNGGSMWITYFFDTTAHSRLISEYDRVRPAVMYILIDNYDELFSSVKETEKNQCTALIDDTITNWCQQVNGIMRKVERDKYIVIFQNKDMKLLTSKRFEILEKVKKLKLTTKLFPTLSIGVGLSNSEVSESDDFSRMALDMALSRGGDQAVIKSPEGYEFYGESANGIEKRSKVKSRVIAASLAEILKNTDHVLIMGHSYSDLDSLGASVGISRIVKHAGKKPYIVIDRQTTLAESLLFQLEASEEHAKILIDVEKAPALVNNNTTLIIVDTHRGSMVSCPELIEKAKNIVIIDHHRKSVDFIDNTALFFHDPSASSACEMITELVQYTYGCELKQIEAESLLSGIFLDTKHYTIRTTAMTFEASSYLRKAGASTVNVRLMFQTDKDTYMDKVKLVKTAEIYKDIAAIAVWDGEYNGNIKLIASQAADELLNIENILVAFTIFEDSNNIINISARSFGSLNVQIIMEWMGGGGHQTMSGTQLKDISIEEALKLVKEAIDKYLNEVSVKARQ